MSSPNYIEVAITKAIEGGYILPVVYDWELRHETTWNGEHLVAPWLDKWLNFILHLAEGKDAPSFFKSLLTK